MNIPAQSMKSVRIIKVELKKICRIYVTNVIPVPLQFVENKNFFIALRFFDDDFKKIQKLSIYQNSLFSYTHTKFLYSNFNFAMVMYLCCL